MPLTPSPFSRLRRRLAFGALAFEGAVVGVDLVASFQRLTDGA